MQKRFSYIVNHPVFENVVVTAIISCSILLGVETYYIGSNAFFEFFDTLFTLFFTIEIVFRLIAAGSLWEFFRICTIKNMIVSGRPIKKFQLFFEEKGFWNWFDFTIVVFSLISLFAHLVEHPEFLVVSRLFRVLRIMRLLEVSRELREVQKRIVSILPTVFSFALLLGILLYIYAVIGIYMFEHNSFEIANFETLPAALLTLFQAMTLDNWSEMMQTTTNGTWDGWLYRGFFISFVVLTAIVSFNVFVAVLTSQVHRKMEMEKKRNNQEILREIQDIEDDIEQAGVNINIQLMELMKEIKSLREEVRELKSAGRTTV